MTLLDDAPALLASDDVRAALGLAGTTATLLVLTLPTDPRLQDLAETAVRRETRARDLVCRVSPAELAVVLTVPDADLDAVADRLLSVVERATGLPSAGGVSGTGAGRDALTLARAGLDVAWACGGSRAVRHP